MADSRQGVLGAAWFFDDYASTNVGEGGGIVAETIPRRDPVSTRRWRGSWS